MQLDLAGLEFGDGLEDASEQYGRLMQLVLSLDILHLAIGFHVFELFDGQPHCFITLPVQYVLNALQFPIGNQP